MGSVTFERVIISELLILMVFVVAVSTVRHGWKIIEEIMNPPYSFWE
jgi:hypothetical protein